MQIPNQKELNAGRPFFDEEGDFLYEDFIRNGCPTGSPLLVVVRGSQSYGTSLPTSDIDYGGVYIQSIEDILANRYKEQLSDAKGDIVFYEIRRFLELCSTNNPNILELLNTPDDCIIYIHPVMQSLLSVKDAFVTKKIVDSFGGYAVSQIKKANGQDKKRNWEASRVTRKTPRDFCYIHNGYDTLPLKTVLDVHSEDTLGLVKIDHARDLYALYKDYTSGATLGFSGICGEESNDLRLTALPKEKIGDSGEFLYGFMYYMTFNKDAYSSHCKDYKEYQDWLQNRNLTREVETSNHGQKIDGKNLMHTRRLLDMALDALQTGKIIVRRPNSDYLISIRKGAVNLSELIEKAEADLLILNDLRGTSTLPDSLDMEFVHDLLFNIRKSFHEFSFQEEAEFLTPYTT